MDIRPIGFAVWIASVVAVAACSPRADERVDFDTSVAQAAAARAAAARQQQQGQRLAAGGPAEAATGGPQAQPSDPTAVMGGPPAPTSASAAADARITAQVKAELAAAHDLHGARIDIDTRDGVVTLSGPVRSAAVKARASEIARTVRNVREVNDQLTLVMS